MLSILQSREVIPDWALGMVLPIHKDGSRLEQLTIEGDSHILPREIVSLNTEQSLSRDLVENNLLSQSQSLPILNS